MLLFMKIPKRKMALVLCTVVYFSAVSGQVTYDYYSNPAKIGSTNPQATANFIRSFEFIMLWGEEDADSAIYYMQRAIEEDSLYAIAYASLGHMIKYGGYNGTSIDTDSIKKLAEKALAINSRCGDALTLMSWVHFMNNNYQLAIESCKSAVASEPDHRETWFWLGVRYAHLPEKIDSAIYAFHKSLETDSLFGQPHQKLGWIYLYDKPDFQLAAYHFRQMINLYENIVPHDERMILGYYGLGETLIALNKPDHAIDTFNLLLEKCEHSGINWQDNLKSWAYTGLMHAYLQMADTVFRQFLTHNLAIPEKHPDDTGLKLSTIEEFNAVSKMLKKFDYADTLRNVKLPLCEQVMVGTSDDYEKIQAIQFKLQLLQNDNRFDEAVRFLKDVENNAKSGLMPLIHILMACNHAQMDNENKALKYLQKSFKAGFTDYEYVKSEPSFSEIRDHNRFKKVINHKNTDL